MNFQLSEEHEMIREAARSFAQQELLPGVIERDTHEKFPKEQVKMMGELGFMGMYTPEAAGGLGMSRLDASLIGYIGRDALPLFIGERAAVAKTKEAMAVDAFFAEKLGFFAPGGLQRHAHQVFVKGTGLFQVLDHISIMVKAHRQRNVLLGVHRETSFVVQFLLIG